MAYTPYVIVVWALCLVVSRWLYQTLQRAAAFRKARRQHGATRAPRYPHRDLWGYDLYNQRQEATKKGHMMKLYDEQYEQLGHTWEEQFFNQKVINTSDMVNIQHVAALGFDNFGKPDRSYAMKFLGDGIFASEGPKWKFSRDLIKPTFSKAEVGDVKGMELHVNHFLDLIPRDGSTIDMQPLLKRLVSRSSLARLHV